MVEKLELSNSELLEIACALGDASFAARDRGHNATGEAYWLLRKKICDHLRADGFLKEEAA